MKTKSYSVCGHVTQIYEVLDVVVHGPVAQIYEVLMF